MKAAVRTAHYPGTLIAGAVTASSADAVTSTGSSTLIHPFDDQGFAGARPPCSSNRFTSLVLKPYLFWLLIISGSLARGGRRWGCDLSPQPRTLQRREQQQSQEGTGGKAQGETIGYGANTTGLAGRDQGSLEPRLPENRRVQAGRAEPRPSCKEEVGAVPPSGLRTELTPRAAARALLLAFGGPWL